MPGPRASITKQLTGDAEDSPELEQDSISAIGQLAAAQ